MNLSKIEEAAEKFSVQPIEKPMICYALLTVSFISYLFSIYALFLVPNQFTVCEQLCMYTSSHEITDFGIFMGLLSFFFILTFGLLIHGISSIVESVNEIKIRSRI